MTISALQSGDVVDVGVHRLPVWPEGQKVVNWRNTGILVTKFADHGLYAPMLCATTLELSADPARSVLYEQHMGVGSAKVFGIGTWPCAAASLVHARARALFRRATGSATAVVDLCWASVYRDGDCSLPHSHPRTLASVLYALESGESGPNNGVFYFGDPRLLPCCREEAGYMSTPVGPALKPGTMLLFPGKAVHFVSPYRGQRPRLTLSWNINKEAREGSPFPPGSPKPGGAGAG